MCYIVYIFIVFHNKFTREQPIPKEMMRRIKNVKTIVVSITRERQTISYSGIIYTTDCTQYIFYNNTCIMLIRIHM